MSTSSARAASRARVRLCSRCGSSWSAFQRGSGCASTGSAPRLPPPAASLPCPALPWVPQTHWYSSPAMEGWRSRTMRPLSPQGVRHPEASVLGACLLFPVSSKMPGWNPYRFHLAIKFQSCPSGVNRALAQARGTLEQPLHGGAGAVVAMVSTLPDGITISQRTYAVLFFNSNVDGKWD